MRNANLGLGNADSGGGQGVSGARCGAALIPHSGGWAWYLHGIVRLDTAGDTESVRAPVLDDCASVELLPHGDIAAVVTRVPLALFEADSLRAHLKDAAWLESMVRWHQRVVEAFHRERGVLPAKFGCVYAKSADLSDALARAHDALIVQLERLVGCDEWGVRLYADRPTAERRLTTEDPRVRQLQQELVGARPGRAYFLQRKLIDVRAAATDQWL
ncbi:MAG TPA: GvpL/GvpF family gas vesicle protein, partial [Thermoleophilia bacterium]|nr:GvpL/GvpF family gas vesicle protein [Thermoleophilia bacterium]